MEIKVKKVDIDSFRNFNDINFNTGRRITVFSGQNGIGKSNLLSLIASTSGTSKQPNSDASFQPEFDEYFHIYKDELENHYSVDITFESGTNYLFKKNLRLKDDTNSKRGVRFIPTTVKTKNDSRTLKEIVEEVKKTTDTGKEAKVPIPSIFLSLSRTYPLGEDQVTETKLTRRSKLMKRKVNEKYREWYNEVLPHSIGRNNNDFSKVNKSTVSHTNYFMETDTIRLKSQSIGQDNLSHIISALVEFWAISQNDKYNGGILCIDEIDASLHPSAQLSLMDLLVSVSEELNIQIFLSTHSLTILKEIISLKENNPTDYALVYLKDRDLPSVSTLNSYRDLKADLFSQYTLEDPRVKVYFEDPLTEFIFKELIDSSKELNISFDPPLYENFPLHLGHTHLKALPEHEPYFQSVVIVCDGDSRINIQVKIEELINNPDILKGLNTTKAKENVNFLPSYLAPESYLYYIIHKFYKERHGKKNFWRNLERNHHTRLFTAQYVKDEILSIEPLNNKQLKKHPNIEKIKDFITKTRLLTHYYEEEENIKELEDFINNLERSMKSCSTIMKSKRF